MRINSLLQNDFGEIPCAGKFTDGYLYRSGLSSMESYLSKEDWWYFAVWEVQIRLRHFIVHKLRCTVSNQNGISDSWTIDCTIFCWGLERSSNYDVYQSRLFFLSEIRICLLKQILKYKNRKRKNRERVRTDIQKAILWPVLVKFKQLQLQRWNRWWQV